MKRADENSRSEQDAGSPGSEWARFNGRVLGGAYWEASLRQSDRLRRSYGKWLEATGFGPVSLQSIVVPLLPGVQVHDYGGPPQAPAFVIVTAPVKRAYIWDLAPRTSVVRCVASLGLHPFLIEWRECREQASFRLHDYADRLLSAAIETICQRIGQPRIVLAGHSLGGTLAALFAALHPARVAALVLLEAPTKFAADAGAFAPLVEAAPPGVCAKMFDLAPGSFLDLVSVAASPWSFIGARWMDYLTISDDPAALATHLRVERWALDEFPNSAAVVSELVDWLYREDRFMQGRLNIGGRSARPAALNMPLLTVARPSSCLIPPASMCPLYDAAPSRSKRWLGYSGEPSVALQHVGVLVGQRAHAEL